MIWCHVSREIKNNQRRKLPLDIFSRNIHIKELVSQDTSLHVKKNKERNKEIILYSTRKVRINVVLSAFVVVILVKQCSRIYHGLWKDYLCNRSQQDI